MKIHFLFPAFLFICLSVHAGTVKVVNSKTDAKVNPLGITAEQTRFSWQISSSSSNVKQLAYQVCVAEDIPDLKKGKKLIWNTGKVTSDRSVWIDYAGKKLVSGKKYYWKVRVWTNKGASRWSEAAFFTTGLLNNDEWKAQWIGLDSLLPGENLDWKTRVAARYLRKEFKPVAEIKKATLYICGLGMYECYINGKKISNDVFAPSATDYSKRVFYNTYDVKSLISNKQNAIGVILGNGRFVSMRRDYSKSNNDAIPPITHFGMPKLLFQLEIEYSNGRKEFVVSDTSWKITAKGPITANNEFDGEDYDARLEMPGWDVPGYNDKSWLKAQLTTAPEGRLMAQTNPNLATMRVIKPISVKELSKGKYIVDMGQNMVGWVSVKLKGNAGKPVQMRFAETLQDNGELYTTNLRGARCTNTYIPSTNDKFTYEPRFVYQGFRFFEITGIDYLPSTNDIEGKVNYDYMKTTGYFESSDTTLNQIYRNATWGIMGNYRSFPTDCPQRDERMAWLGDRATGCFGESFIFDNYLLYSKWAHDIQDAQLETGSVPDVAPTYWRMYNDNITWPGLFVRLPEMLFQQFGDDKPIREHYPALKKWVNHILRTTMKDNLITRDTYGDWCMPPEDIHQIHSKDTARITNGELLASSFFYRILTTMAGFAEISGNLQDAPAYREQARKLKSAYNSKFFHVEKNYYDNNTVTANLISLMQGLVPEGREQMVFDNLAARIENDFNSHVSVGLIGIQFLMRGLTAYNRADLALKIATTRTYPGWGYMIDNGATTIWELWNGNTADPAMNSGNHVMLLGDLLSWYYEDVAGIKTDPEFPGFKKIIMKPSFPIGLNHAKAHHESAYGTIRSEWKIEDRELIWDVTIPANSSADIILPVTNPNQVKLNKKAISESGLVQVSGNQVKLNLGSGNYRINVHKPDI